MMLVLGGCETSGSPRLPTRIVQVYTEAYPDWVTYTLQTVSNLHHSLKTVSLKTAPTVGGLGRVYIPRAENGVRKFQLPPGPYPLLPTPPLYSFTVNQGSQPFNNFLQRFFLCFFLQKYIGTYIMLSFHYFSYTKSGILYILIFHFNMRTVGSV